MKTGFIAILLMLFSCQSNNNKTIVGSWQLTGSKYGTGAEIIANEVDQKLF